MAFPTSWCFIGWWRQNSFIDSMVSYPFRQTVLQKFRSRLTSDGWITLIRAALSNLPIYLRYLQRQQKTLRRSTGFFIKQWGKMRICTSGKCLPKGWARWFGSRKNKERNMALLGKWLWRFPLEPHSSWAKVTSTHKGPKWMGYRMVVSLPWILGKPLINYCLHSPQVKVQVVKRDSNLTKQMDS